MSRKFAAQYPGRCPACVQPIEVGDDLIFDDDAVVVHFDCANRQQVLTKPREVCTGCFIEKAASGACGCDE